MNCDVPVSSMDFEHGFLGDCILLMEKNPVLLEKIPCWPSILINVQSKKFYPIQGTLFCNSKLNVRSIYVQLFIDVL